jgi:hypothetical protein
MLSKDSMNIACAMGALFAEENKSIVAKHG